MDENTERDTHFAGAAKLLLQRLMGKYDHLPPGQFGPAEKDEQIIAHFAYDLAEYIYNHTTEAMTHFDTFESLVEAGDYPDLKEWPTP